MEFQPIDLPAVLGVVMGTSIVLIPVLAFSMRFALKPLVESLQKMWMAKENADRALGLERRVIELERQLHSGGSAVVGLEVPSRVISRLD